MHQYHALLYDILDNGQRREDRTGVGTISVFARQLRFDLKRGFPAITTKKLAWRAVIGELLWFLEGSGDERRLAEITHGTRCDTKTTIWSANANAAYWQEKAQFPGDLGRIYGVQWRDWGGIDQIKSLIKGLKEDPNSRRHIISSWNVGELDEMALPPCHIMSQFYVSNSKLSCHMYQRSVDVFLGLPFNIASYALLTHIIAHLCDMQVGELIISTGDTHIYSNHIDQVQCQLDRYDYPLPTLKINPEIKALEDFKMEDFSLENYLSHGVIRANMAV
jgi:thymidylate synthase